MSELPTDDEFAAYWHEVDAELASLPARPLIERIPGRCTDDFTGYEVWLTSIGPHRIFAYLSVPTGDGPFPGLLATPRYGSVNNPPHYADRLRYVTVTVMHRGQRLADSPYAASYPGLLTDGIADEQSYVYRGIVADCLRAAEFLAGHPAVALGRIAVAGDDLALMTAARRPVFSAVQINDVLLYLADEKRRISADYPVEELNEYVRAYPDRAGAVARTLGFFDAERHAPDLRAANPPAKVRIDVPGSGPTATLADLLGAEIEPYVPTHEGQTDLDAADRWMSGLFGTEPVSRFDRTYA